MAEKVIMSGNEAIARGAYEGGCVFASAYPGTPSTEILENMPQYKENVYSEWAPNEKVAAEAAIGASIAGVRSFCAMKHVGLNVAADPVFTVAYTGVTGGLVIISADDPGQHSSQNEQDNRNYAKAARLLMLEPSSSQECKDYMKMAFALSEKFDAPVLFHVTTRVCHSKGIVELGERVEADYIPYEKKITKYVSAPANAKKMRVNLETKLQMMEEYANTCEINQPEWHDKKIGVVTSGISYQYAKETFGENASYLKLGMTFPLPTKLIEDFCAQVEKVYVIEEMDPYLQEFLQIHGIECVGKPVIPTFDELNTDIVREALTGEVPESYESELKSVVRPPSLCAGCPHRASFYAVKKAMQGRKTIFCGDIGCYTLGNASPLDMVDTCLCMGAGLNIAQGVEKIEPDTACFAFVGDSTFFASAITGVVNAVYNQANMTLVVLDNSTTAMTGHQPHPGTGRTVMGEIVQKINIEQVLRGIGVQDVETVNPLDHEAAVSCVKELADKPGVKAIIFKSPCIAVTKPGTPMHVDISSCIHCKKCIRELGCPAIITEDGNVSIDSSMCTGCGLCSQICPVHAIKGGKQHD